MKSNSLPLEDLRVLVLDIQATASNPSRGHLIEIGWVGTSAAEVTGIGEQSLPTATFLFPVPKKKPLPRNILRLTGIKDEEFKQALSENKIRQKLFTEVKEIVKRNSLSICPTVIHYARYEEPFLRMLQQKEDPDELFPLQLICTHRIAAALLPGLPRKGIRAVSGYFGYSLSEFRRSFSHVAATAFVWRHLVSMLKSRLGIETCQDFFSWLEKVSVAPTGKNKCREYPMDPQDRTDLPHRPGVYRMLRSNGDVLYIGKATSLKQRIASYFYKHSRHPEHILEMLSQAQKLDFTCTDTALEAALLETDEIKLKHPPYNKALQEKERKLYFCSPDFLQCLPQPGKSLKVGPLPDERSFYALAALDGLMEPAAREVITPDLINTIYDTRAEFAPEQDCFTAGFNSFLEEHEEHFIHRSRFLDFMRLGSFFWKEKMLEVPVPEEEESPQPDVPEWTPERVVKALKSVIRRGTHQVRRSRWLCRLSESILVWEESNKVRHRLVFSRGKLLRQQLPDFSRSICTRQKTFDLTVYDRLRVLTTEMKRLTEEAENIELQLGKNLILKKEKLQEIFKWV